MGKVLDGKTLSDKILDGLKSEDNQNKTLVVITIGEDPASKIYVRNKQRACEEVGVTFRNIEFSDTASAGDILYTIGNLNYGAASGAIIQLPIVSKVLSDDDKYQITNSLNSYLDVDGFQPQSPFTPCTPKGIIRLIDSIPNYDYEGKTALVIGRSNIVGKPIAKLLLDKNCTVVQAHSKTPRDVLLRMFSTADVVVSAVGKANLITEEDAWQYWKDNRYDFYGDFSNKRNRVIIDVGMNRDGQGKLCGDLPESFKDKYSEYYTPVPGGVGPMTVAMLIENTVKGPN